MKNPASKAAILNLPGESVWGYSGTAGYTLPALFPPLLIPPLFDGLLGLSSLPHILVEGGGGAQWGQGLSKQQEKG